jgi:FlaG/FlaF family flagellin (archaellin)
MLWSKVGDMSQQPERAEEGATSVVGEILMIVLAIAVTGLVTYHLVGFTDILGESPYAAIDVEHDAEAHAVALSATNMGNSDHVNVTARSDGAVATGQLTRTGSLLVVEADEPTLHPRGGAVAFGDWDPAPPSQGDTVEIRIVAVRGDRETLLSVTEIDGL